MVNIYCVFMFSLSVFVAGAALGCENDSLGPQEVYQALLYDIHAGDVADVRGFIIRSDLIDEEVKEALAAGVGVDSLLESSLMAGCGFIDVKACYKEAPEAVVQQRKPKGEDFYLACIRYSGYAVGGDWLMADVYFSRRSDGGWRFVSVDKNYFDFAPELESIDGCWRD